MADLFEVAVDFILSVEGGLVDDPTDPVRVVNGRYLAPAAPGYSIEIRPESLSEYAFPDGAGWWKEEVTA